MKIGIEVQRLFRKKKHGMEVVALQTLLQLQKLKSETAYYIFTKTDDDNTCIASSDDFFIIETPAKPYPVWEQLLLPKMAKKENVDLLHCTSNTAPLYCNTPMVITIHDIIYLDKVDFGGSNYQNFGNLYRRFIVPRVAKKAKAIITVSEYTKKLLVERLNIPKQRIHVVHNGVSEDFKKLPETTVRDFKRKNNLPEKFFLHFGNTAARKNTSGTIEAYARYYKKTAQAWPLLLTNFTAEELSVQLAKMHEHTLAENIICLGYISNNDLPVLYNAASVFIYPSLSEGFGMPVIESMACGTPVITANLTSLPEVAGDAALLIDPNNCTAIAEAMLSLQENKDLYAEMQSKGFKNAGRFTWKSAAEKTLSVYNKTMQQIKNTNL